MGKIREISEVERGQIIALLSEGLSQLEISKKMKISRCAVQTTIRRYQNTSSLKSLHRSGRPRKSGCREDRILIREALKDRKKTSSELASSFSECVGAEISARTVRRRLVAAGLKGCKARKKPLLSVKNKSKRLFWAKSVNDWIFDDFAKIVWSDETNIEVRFYF